MVEDDPTLLEFYCDLLTGEGHVVDPASDGDLGFGFAFQGGYDLILLDVNLPKKEGPQILEELTKTPPKNPNKKIVMLTNAIEKEIEEKVKAFGVEDFLLKSSLTPDDFLVKVKAVLSSG